MKNTMLHKIKRTFTSILPVSKARTGQCKGCGECFKLPNVCPFLKFSSNGKSFCSIYKLRPLNCRKYPRTYTESRTKHVCGFKFLETHESLGEKIMKKFKKTAIHVMKIIPVKKHSR